MYLPLKIFQRSTTNLSSEWDPLEWNLDISMYFPQTLNSRSARSWSTAAAAITQREMTHVQEILLRIRVGIVPINETQNCFTICK